MKKFFVRMVVFLAIVAGFFIGTGGVVFAGELTITPNEFFPGDKVEFNVVGETFVAGTKVFLSILPGRQIKSEALPVEVNQEGQISVSLKPQLSPGKWNIVVTNMPIDQVPGPPPNIRMPIILAEAEVIVHPEVEVRLEEDIEYQDGVWAQNEYLFLSVTNIRGEFIINFSGGEQMRKEVDSTHINAYALLIAPREYRGVVNVSFQVGDLTEPVKTIRVDTVSPIIKNVTIREDGGNIYVETILQDEEDRDGILILRLPEQKKDSSSMTIPLRYSSVLPVEEIFYKWREPKVEVMVIDNLGNRSDVQKVEIRWGEGPPLVICPICPKGEKIYTLQFHKGVNLFSLPVRPTRMLDAYGGEYLVGSTVGSLYRCLSISSPGSNILLVFEKDGKLESWGPNAPPDAGINRPLKAGDGYILVTSHPFSVRLAGVMWESDETPPAAVAARGLLEFAEFLASQKPARALQNFPNPFNPETWVPYQLAQDVSVTVRIYNAKGQLIRTIDLGRKVAGTYLTKDKAVYWDGRDNVGEKVASGVYFYTLQAGEFVTTTRRMVVRK